MKREIEPAGYKHIHTDWHVDTLSRVFKRPDGGYEVTLTHSSYGNVVALVVDGGANSDSETMLWEISESLPVCIEAIRKHKSQRSE